MDTKSLILHTLRARDVVFKIFTFYLLALQTLLVLPMAEGGQRVFLMRHGARHDAVYPAWKKTAERPYDTPLSHRGQAETPKLVLQRLSGKVKFGLLIEFLPFTVPM